MFNALAGGKESACVESIGRGGLGDVQRCGRAMNT